MTSEEIQTTDPSGVSEQPIRTTRHEAATNPDSALSIPDLRMPLPDKNVPAWLSFGCGLVAFVFALVGYVTALDSPYWLAAICGFHPIVIETAALLGIAAFLLGVLGCIERTWYPTSGGLPWALGGLTASGLALYVVLETFGELCSHWS